LSITHHTKKQLSTGPRTTHGPHLVTHINSPKCYLKSFSRLGDLGMTLGRCSCEFVSFLLCSFSDSPHMPGGQSTTDGQSATPRGPFCGLFRQNHYFSAGGDFCTAERPRPVLRTVHPFSGGQCATARRTVHSVSRILPSLIGSFASSLVLPWVFQGIVPRTCS
jgi:hypothetical protein